MDQTRRYGQLYGLFASSPGGLQPLSEACFAIWAKGYHERHGKRSDGQTNGKSCAGCVQTLLMQLHQLAKSAYFSKISLTFEPIMQCYVIQDLESLKPVRHSLFYSLGVARAVLQAALLLIH